jgi:hypothetical protein
LNEAWICKLFRRFDSSRKNLRRMLLKKRKRLRQQQQQQIFEELLAELRSLYPNNNVDHHRCPGRTQRFRGQDGAISLGSAGIARRSATAHSESIQ